MLDQRVVAGIGAADGVAAHRDGFAECCVLVAEHAARSAAQRDHVAAQGSDRGRAGQGRGGGGVIHLVAGGQSRDGEIGRADVGGQSGLLDQRVVAGVGAADGVAAHRDGFAGCCVLVAEHAARSAAQRDHVAAQGNDRGRAGQGRGGGGVIHLVAGGQSRDREIGRGDVGGGGVARQRVVARTCAGETQSAYGHSLADADILVGEGAARAANQAHDVAGVIISVAARRSAIAERGRPGEA